MDNVGINNFIVKLLHTFFFFYRKFGKSENKVEELSEKVELKARSMGRKRQKKKQENNIKESCQVNIKRMSSTKKK